jgi:hypothetical protein
MTRSSGRWALLVSANVAAWGVLGFQGWSGAAPQDVRQPFDNAVQQRAEMIRELQEIKAAIREQNGLLRAALNRPENHERKAKL